MVWGNWFCLVFFLGGGLYFGGGAIYGFIKLGKDCSGDKRQLVPHIEFWASVVGLFFDGVAFTRQSYDAWRQGTSRLKGSASEGLLSPPDDKVARRGSVPVAAPSPNALASSPAEPAPANAFEDVDDIIE
eukprot:SAG31_NODE_2415_length_5732_cov_7.567016_8_plen_130_part_00